MKQLILPLAHRGPNFMASLWNLAQDEVYGSYHFLDGKLCEISHNDGLAKENASGLARYTPAWLIQAESFISEFLNEKSELGTIDRNIGKWQITIHVDILSEGIPKDPLASIISMQPYQQ